MPKCISKNYLKEALNTVAIQLGIEIKSGAVFFDPMQFIIKLVLELVNKGLLKLYPDMILEVQVLGDATSVWQSMKINGTAIVLKVIYNGKNSVGKKVIGDGANTVQKQRSIGFYLGDDTQAQLRFHAPNLLEQLAKVSTDGIVVDGVHIRV
jgi:hypothetical protein